MINVYNIDGHTFSKFPRCWLILLYGVGTNDHIFVWYVKAKIRAQ